MSIHKADVDLARVALRRRALTDAEIRAAIRQVSAADVIELLPRSRPEIIVAVVAAALARNKRKN